MVNISSLVTRLVRHSSLNLPQTLGTILLIAGLVASCAPDGDDDDEGDPTGPPAPTSTTPANLDPNVAPVTQGAWSRPGTEATWQWQLQGTINTSYAVDIYDIDLFDAPDPVVTVLKNGGILVLCYFSAGSGENWRSDYNQIPRDALGEPLDGWEGERWLDVRAQEVYNVMLGRMELAVARGCDGVELDNMTAYNNNSGFPLTASDQLAYNRNLANEAHLRNLFIALKNAGEQAVTTWRTSTSS